MSLPIRDVVGILGDNLRLRGSVLPISARKATRWTRGLELPRGGETVLYTGQMYQLIPYIERLVAVEQRLGDSPLARFSGLGRRVNRLVNISAFMGRPSRRERAQYDAVPRRVVRLLREAGIEFGSCTKTTSTPERSPMTSDSTSSWLRTPGACVRHSASTA